MDVEVADETTGRADGRPSATTGRVVLVISLPRRTRRRPIRHGSRSENINEASEGSEDDLAVRAVLEM